MAKILINSNDDFAQKWAISAYEYVCDFFREDVYAHRLDIPLDMSHLLDVRIHTLGERNLLEIFQDNFMAIKINIILESEYLFIAYLDEEGKEIIKNKEIDNE